VAQGKRPLGFDHSQHTFYSSSFSQRAINKIFIRIDTSKANFEGEHAQQHQTIPPNNWVPPQPPPADPPKGGTTPDASVNLKYSTQGPRAEDSLQWKQYYYTTLLHTTTHPPPNPSGNVLPTSWAPSPPPPAGSPRVGLTPDAPVNLKNSTLTLTYDHLGGSRHPTRPFFVFACLLATSRQVVSGFQASSTDRTHGDTSPSPLAFHVV